jgi:predicted permease
VAELHRVLRRLSRERQFSLGVVLTLSIAIGGAGALLSLLNAIVLRPLAVPRPERLVAVYPGLGEALFGVPVRTLRELRNAQDVVLGLCGYSRGALDVEVEGVVTQHRNEGLTGECYRMLGVHPLVGRLIDERDDVGESAPVVVISHRFWTRAFHADPAIVGRTLRANGLLLTVIGVTPPAFDGIDIERAPDLTVPLGTMSRLLGSSPEAAVALQTIGRLRDGITIDDARARMRAIWADVYAATNPVRAGRQPSPAAAAESLRVESIARGLSEQRTLYGPALAILLTLSVVLVLLACLNIGALFLLRVSTRSHEFAIRTMLGASRWRLGRPLCLEAVLLAALAALLAVPIASATSRFLAATAWIRTTPMTLEVDPDGRVLAVMALAGVILGLAISLPSVGVALMHPADTFRRGAGIASATTTSWQRVLLTAQVTLSLILVFSAGLFARNLSAIRSIDPGYDPDDLRWTRLELAFGQPRRIDQAAYFRPLLDDVRALPEAITAALSLSFPTTEVRHVAALPSFRRAGIGPDSGDIRAYIEYVSPNFFDTLRLPVLEGRDFDWADAEKRPAVAIVNRALATKLFRNSDALGSSVQYDSGAGPASFTIVGVAAQISPGDVRIGELPIVYLPLLQHSQFMAAPILIVRTSSDRRLEEGLRKVIESRDRHKVAGLQTIRDQANRFHMRERVLAAIAAAFAALSLLVAGIGLYALLMNAVARRTPELGLRMALGATGARMLALVMRDGLSLVVIGIALGIPAALAARRAVSPLLFERSPYEGISLMASCFAIVAVAVAACGWPALRAVRLAPADALRDE